MVVSSLDRRQKSVRMLADTIRSRLSIERYTGHRIHGHKGLLRVPLERQNIFRISNRRPLVPKTYPRQSP